MDTKIAVAVRSDLAQWQKLNVAAFLTSGLATRDRALIGAPYEDGGGVTYMPMLRHPVIVLTGDQAAMTRSLRRARERCLGIAVYIDAMFATSTDADNRATVKAVPTDALQPAGLLVHGERRDVDKALDRLSPHP
jgi:hypothetical protein